MNVKSFSVTASVLLLVMASFPACNQTNSKKGNIESLMTTDHCSKAAAVTNKITAFSKTSIYTISKDKILVAFLKDSLEHAISFGKDAAENTILSAMTTGNAHSSDIRAITNMFADIHNHPKGTAPSSGDLYGLIQLATANIDYKTRYVITNGNGIYALTVVDLEAATNFVKKYPSISNPGYQPGFPDSLVDEFNRTRAVYSVKDETVMAFILKKYNTGVLLLKQSDDGKFKCIATKEVDDSAGLNNYT